MMLAARSPGPTGSLRCWRHEVQAQRDIWNVGGTKSRPNVIFVMLAARNSGPSDDIGGTKSRPNVILECWSHEIQAQRGLWGKTQSCHSIGQEIERECHESGE